MSDAKELRGLFLDKLAESGIAHKDAIALGFDVLSPKEVQKLDPSFKAHGAMRIPYFDLAGKRTGFYRLRYLGEFDGFDALRKKQLRYVQLPGSASEIYLPPVVEWKDIASNQSVGLFITEGELKAACATIRGFPTVGLGGVWSWKSKKHGFPLLPALTKFNWKGRFVYLVFDSDFSSNPDVLRALVHLSKELSSHGAQPYMVALPDLPELIEKGKKTGLDDFLMHKGVDEFQNLISEAAPFSESEELWKLNSEVVYIKKPGLVIVLDDGRKISPSDFKNHAYANRHYYETQTSGKGESKLVKKPLAPAWLAWECRSELKALTYKPAAPKITDGGEYNYWKGWGAEPKKGDIALWKQLLDYMFAGNIQARTWFERWCAYPIQHPGTKLYSAVVLWGRQHGTGKSLIGYTLQKVYGENFVEIGDEELAGSFNEWAENRQFVMADDITSADAGERRSLNEKLRRMITRQKMRINAKYLPTYELVDCLNWYFTANHPDTFQLDDKDRRFFIWETPQEPLPREFYERYDRWLHKGDVGASMLWHLQHIDLGDFNPREHAMMTSAKKRMIFDSKNELAAWCAQLAEDPDSVLKFGSEPVKADLFTAHQLHRIFNPDSSMKINTMWLGRELKRAGFIQVNEGALVRTAKGPQRLYAIRNSDKWAKAKPVELAEHWNKHFSTEKNEHGKKRQKRY